MNAPSFVCNINTSTACLRWRCCLPACSSEMSMLCQVKQNSHAFILTQVVVMLKYHHFLGNFWHITDLHWDPTYEVTEVPERVCGSSGGLPAAAAGPFGDYACDSPWHLIDSSVNAMKAILPDPDFIVWTGSVPGSKWPESTQSMI